MVYRPSHSHPLASLYFCTTRISISIILLLHTIDLYFTNFIILIDKIFFHTKSFITNFSLHFIVFDHFYSWSMCLISSFWHIYIVKSHECLAFIAEKWRKGFLSLIFSNKKCIQSTKTYVSEWHNSMEMIIIVTKVWVEIFNSKSSYYRVSIRNH